MDKYKAYMDRVDLSPEFKARLKGQSVPRRRPLWQTWGTLAAALVLVVSLGAWALTRQEPGTSPAVDAVPSGAMPSEAPKKEIIVFPSQGTTPPGMEKHAAYTATEGGYEVREGEVASYFFLPLIRYGQVDEEMSVDLALPVGVSRRDLTEEELYALFGGEKNVQAHLAWGGYRLYAFAMVYEDGSLWRLHVGGSRGDTGYEHFSLEVAPGHIPTSCLVYGEGVVNEIWGKEVTAEAYDGEYASTRRVSFMNETYGYRFEINGADVEQISELAARAVVFITNIEGMALVNPAAGLSGGDWFPGGLK